MSDTDAFTDVVELCALLQCLGFTVKSLNTSDGNVSQDVGARTVVVNCQSSGLHVVLESAGLSCSCPVPNSNNSSFWQVSGVAGGRQADKETGSGLLSSLPKSYRDNMARDLREMIRCIKNYNETDAERPREKEINRSASLVDMRSTTPEKIHLQIKTDTPTRYRSLDTLTSAKEAEMPLPEPGALGKHLKDLSGGDDEKSDKDVQAMCRRQSTYTISSTPGSIRRRNKTSSPIHAPSSTLLENLIAAEKVSEDLRNKLSLIIRECLEEGKNDTSMSSLALDVSKISVLKGEKAQFASSPNLSGMGSMRDDLTKGKLKRFESASTSNLGPNNDTKTSKLRRMSPNIFKQQKETPNIKDKLQDSKSSKLKSLFKPKIVTPIRVPKTNTEASPSFSSTKKKYSHIKSTIPRLTAKKE